MSKHDTPCDLQYPPLQSGMAEAIYGAAPAGRKDGWPRLTGLIVPLADWTCLEGGQTPLAYLDGVLTVPVRGDDWRAGVVSGLSDSRSLAACMESTIRLHSGISDWVLMSIAAQSSISPAQVLVWRGAIGALALKLAPAHRLNAIIHIVSSTSAPPDRRLPSSLLPAHTQEKILRSALPLLRSLADLPAVTGQVLLSNKG